MNETLKEAQRHAAQHTLGGAPLHEYLLGADGVPEPGQLRRMARPVLIAFLEIVGPEPEPHRTAEHWIEVWDYVDAAKRLMAP